MKIRYIIITLSVIVLTVIALGVLFRHEIQRFLLYQEYGKEIASLCTAPVSGQATNAVLPPKPWHALVIEGDKQHLWHNRLPDEVRATGRDSVDAVICLSPTRSAVVEECAARTIVAEEHTIPRIQYYRDVTIFSAQTRQPIGTLRVYGAAPQDCGPFVQVTQKGVVFKGEQPTFRNFYDTIINVLWY